MAQFCLIFPLKREFLYGRNTVDGKFFVTARGWEDLSEILKSYEELQVEIGEELIGEFLRKKRKLQEILPVITDCMRSINLIIRYRKFLMEM